LFIYGKEEEEHSVKKAMLPLRISNGQEFICARR
jgi:hypothetical protein